MVQLSARGMDVPAIAKMAFTSEDLVGDVIRNFSADGLSSLYAKYKAGRPPKFTLGEREIKKIIHSKPAEHSLPFSARRLSKSLVADRTVDNISYEGLRWAAVSGQSTAPGRRPRPRMRATRTRTEGVRHLPPGCDQHQDNLYEHVGPRQAGGRFPGFCRYLHSHYRPPYGSRSSATTSALI